MAFNEHKKIAMAKREFLKTLDQMVPVMGNDALNHFKDSFQNQGFTNETTEKWKPRRRPDRKRPGRAILIDTGRLRRSLRYSRLKQYTVQIQSNVPYANRHNEGLDGMTQRQFVGYSSKLNKRLIAKFDQRIKTIFRQ
jgi:phage gpG-like protein